MSEENAMIKMSIAVDKNGTKVEIVDAAAREAAQENAQGIDALSAEIEAIRNDAGESRETTITYDDLSTMTTSEGYLLGKGEYQGIFQDGLHWATSDFIQIPPKTLVQYVLPAHMNVSSLCFYNENQSLLSCIDSDTTGGTLSGMITSPAATKYYRFTMYTKDDNNHGLRVEQYVKVIENAPTDHLLFGKRWSLLGDSRTAAGHTVATKYYNYISDKAGGMVLTNHAVSGARMADQAAAAAGMSETADIISVYVGVNDWGQSSPTTLGSVSDTAGADTFYGQTKAVIETLLNGYPKALLFFITPVGQMGFESFAASGAQSNALGHTIFDYVDAIKTCCAMYGVAVCDDAWEGGCSPLVEAQNAMYFADGLHQNDAGHQKLADHVYRFLQAHVQGIF